MAATYFVCISSNVKYSTVTWAPCFCAQRCAAASTALLVGSTYVLRIQSLRLAPFLICGAARPGSASAAEAPTAPASRFRRLSRRSRIALLLRNRFVGISGEWPEYRARAEPCQGSARMGLTMLAGSRDDVISRPAESDVILEQMGGRSGGVSQHQR